jgi:GH25 family lysozyme M1 (1,4-beta-N-acetylmuramidase)/LysM repeat protein
VIIMANTIGPLGQILYQGVTINEFSGQVDFSKARNAGLGTVYIRATAGCDYADANLSSYAASARNAGLLVGYYHYLNARTVSEARAQARHFLRAIQDLPIDLRPALLVETVSGLTIDEANEIALAFLQTVQYASGLVPILYTDARSAELLWTSDIARNYPLWVIDTGSADSPDVSDALWSAWTGWQYTDTGRIDGIPGPAKLSTFTGNIVTESEEQCLQRPMPEGTKIICVTVAYGDTLSGIANLFGTTVREIVRINNISNPNRIYPGNRIYLRVPASTPVAPCDSYTVKRGDTISSIASRLGIDQRELISINQLANPNLIYPGQVLKLPE